LVGLIGEKGLGPLEIESLFSGTRWEILKAISERKLSPIELADKMKTTSANISQQLRLLELGGLVKSERTSNIDKGKPRIVYSLAGDTSFLIISSPNFTEKKMLPLTAYHKFMMKAWFLENIEHHSLLSEIYFKIKDQLTNIKLIAAQSTSKELIIYLVTEGQKTQDTLKKLTEDSKKVRIVVLELPEFRKKSSIEKLLVLYDPNRISSEVGRND
jgi:predicted transcriptional regulator